MNTNKSYKPLLLGIACILFSLMMLGMSGIMMLLKEEENDTTILAASLAVASILPMLIAVACFAPSLRTMVLKFCGVLTAVGCAAILVNAVINQDGQLKLRMVLAVLAGMIFGIFLAWKGKWPKEDEQVETTTS